MKIAHLISIFILNCVSQVAFGNYGGSDIRMIEEEFCKSLQNQVKCDQSQKYRTINGVCNNLRRPYLGAANTRLIRERDVRYADGLFAPPKSISGADLPSARRISLEIFNDENSPDKNLTIAAMQFGQFVAHDFAGSVGNVARPFECCSQDGQIMSSDNLRCYNIPVPPNDPIHQREQCLNFVRDLPHTELRCVPKPSPADQINKATSFLDLSLIYGNNRIDTDAIRSFVDGKFRMEQRNGEDYPLSVPMEQCPTEQCFFGADPRMNIVPQLTIIHIVFIREHNRVAGILKGMNPSWNDEILFEEARRIIISKYQYIVYYEWLPVLLGLDNLKENGLFFQDSGPDYSHGYDAGIDPSVINEFTAGAFRFFHTQIEGRTKGLDKDRHPNGELPLSDFFFRPQILAYSNAFSSLCRGMTHQAAQSKDENYDSQIRSYFLKQNKQFGSDLKAIDIQRDRDHGLPSYNQMREVAGLPKATGWGGFLDVMSMESVRKLSAVYESFEDVDFSVGGALEKSYDSTVGHGPTYHHLLMKQFFNSRNGDRFWFEFNDPAGSFTNDQLVEIRKSRLSRIICDNVKDITRMQENVFKIPDEFSVKNCSDLPIVDLHFWRE